ncbi:hypothetical protein K4K53_012722 [Colletotrichum sp. SAR 10_77]|nr:hypothetical protein K4K53_012722 [Colletotrichum sp. SAR 10_77]
MHPPAALTLLLSLSTTANAFPVLDFLLHPRDKPAKSYSVVNVEGSPSTGSPDVVTVTKEPAQVTVTERVSDPVTQISSAVQTTTTTSIIVVNVDGTDAPTTVTITPTQKPAPEPTSIPPTTPPPAAPPSSTAAPEPPVSSSDDPQPLPSSEAPQPPDPSAVVCLAEHFSALALAIGGLSVILLGDKYAPAIRAGLEHP